MNITNETKLTQQGTCFSDGSHGSATQTHEIFADDVSLGIKSVAQRQSKNVEFTRSFFAGGKEYTEFKDAAIGAGHEWNRDR